MAKMGIAIAVAFGIAWLQFLCLCRKLQKKFHIFIWNYHGMDRYYYIYFNGGKNKQWNFVTSWSISNKHVSRTRTIITDSADDGKRAPSKLRSLFGRRWKSSRDSWLKSSALIISVFLVYMENRLWSPKQITFDLRQVMDTFRLLHDSIYILASQENNDIQFT